jgi:hypothetical protein
MTPPISEIWVYLSASPLLGLTITLLAYQGAFWIYQRSGCNPLANPVLIAVTVLVLFLTLTATSYETYFEGAKFVHFLLGPATVALAIPLYMQLTAFAPCFCRSSSALLAGSLTAAISAVPSAACSVPACHPAIARPQVGHDADCHGHCRTDRRHSFADRRAGHHHRHSRCRRRALCV